jgi:predicted XRE-type DNA-binding protein
MTVTRHNRQGKTKRGRWPENYLSQEKAAALLGVSREHLNRVLNGRIESKRLKARHQQLMQFRNRIQL